jgi:Kef-type K+ transport system membrane component KefB
MIHLIASTGILAVNPIAGILIFVSLFVLAVVGRWVWFLSRVIRKRRLTRNERIEFWILFLPVAGVAFFTAYMVFVDWETRDYVPIFHETQP